MKREEILKLFHSLAQSQGFYGRLLRDIYRLDKSDQDRYLSHLEEQNFKDDIDVILFIEG